MINIRLIKTEDRNSVLKVLHETGMFTDEEIKIALELIDVCISGKEQKDYMVYVAEHGNEIAGYICYGPVPASDGTFDLYWIAISPKMQKRGIGKQLLAFVEKEIAVSNGRLIIIETSSQEKYHATRNFYMRNHYALEARIKDFYREGDDRLIYTKRINSMETSKKLTHGA